MYRGGSGGKGVINFVLRGWYFSIPLSIGGFFLAKQHVTYLRKNRHAQVVKLRDEIIELGGNWDDCRLCVNSRQLLHKVNQENPVVEGKFGSH